MLNLVNLDAETWARMLEEAQADEAQGTLYLSPRLSGTGTARYPAMLREAIETGTDVTLAQELAGPGILNEYEERNTKKGTIQALVPVTAPETLAEGEFNRFYARGLCRRALADGFDAVEVYRAKAVANPRQESQAMLGARVGAAALLDDLRTHQGVEPALGLPPGPNSGLSVKLP